MDIKDLKPKMDVQKFIFDYPEQMEFLEEPLVIFEKAFEEF